MSAIRKVTAQIASLIRKVDDEEYVLDLLTEARNDIISVIKESGGVVEAGEECPPSNPSCDPPENPPPGP